MLINFLKRIVISLCDRYPLVAKLVDSIHGMLKIKGKFYSVVRFRLMNKWFACKMTPKGVVESCY